MSAMRAALAVKVILQELGGEVVVAHAA